MERVPPPQPHKSHSAKYAFPDQIGWIVGCPPHLGHWGGRHCRINSIGILMARLAVGWFDPRLAE